MADVRDRIREYWDRDSATYDRSPSHALTNPVEAAAWRAALRRHLPEPGSHILEAGAGTGSVTLLLAELGFRVTALDLSEGMLARARDKLAGHEQVEFVTGPADQPPSGPFDAVVERNMLWTNPDPVGSMTAWREVTKPGGRLLVLEGIEGGLLQDLRWRAAEVVRRTLRIPDDHHDHYDAEVEAALPLAGADTPGPLIDAVRRAGWSGIRLERLRDVEWARRMAPPRLLGLLETPSLFAVGADA
jgi:ubiquinone/menaquinone biosynthesis C-methylase UbiE